MRTRRTGTTLIEVLAGLLVLGTLLVSVTIARGRFLQQWREADRKIAAARSTDELIGRWMAGPASAIPVNSEGSLAAPSGCAWRTRFINDATAATLESAVLRVEVIDRSLGERPLLTVDLLVPISVAPQRTEGR